MADIARALHLDQKRLYRTIERLLADLRALLKAEGSPATPSTGSTAVCLVGVTIAIRRQAADRIRLRTVDLVRPRLTAGGNCEDTVAAEALTHRLDRCPDAETLAAYLDGRLSDRERTGVTAHLAECEECYALFRESAQTHLEDAERVVAMWTWRERLPRPKVLWPSAAVMATAAAVWLVVGGGVLAPRDAGLRALVAAVGTNRPIEGRLSGGFEYGPAPAPIRAGESATLPVAPDVRIAAAQIEKSAAAERTARTLRSLGIAYLVTGDAARAVPILEEAADGPSPDARVLSDLAAAYLARGVRNQPQDLAKAATMAERAVKADPALVEAWFNRACALERLSLRDEARRAWQDYLKVDGSSGWAAEARDRLKVLGESPQSKSQDEERREIELASSGLPNPGDLRP